MIVELVQQRVNLPFHSVQATIALLEEGATVPFIARYRKERTDGMDEEQIRAIESALKYVKQLQERKETILNSIREQNKLTPELEAQIVQCDNLTELEDLYLPYKPKRKTKGTIAIENGLLPLAEKVLDTQLVQGDKASIVSEFLNEKVTDVKSALEGAMYIVMEQISDRADIRQWIRTFMQKEGILTSTEKENTVEEAHKYEIYFDFKEVVPNLKPHQILAINRGEKEGVLKVSIEVDIEDITSYVQTKLKYNSRAVFAETLLQAIKYSLKYSILPAIEREIRATITEKADLHAIEVFAQNLRNLLLQPPLLGKIIMGIDPGYVSGCKVAVIDKNGDYLAGDTIYPVPPKARVFEAEQIVGDLIKKYKVDIIAIGNGTASRETEQFIANMIKKYDIPVHYTIVNEAGASVYSASPLAKEEFPDLEAAQRGNISIARRLLDPLAELVKIDPKSIGVGMYQHDVDQNLLKEKLENVVESCVNHVGVDVNTASASLLSYVSGLNGRMAKSIVNYRQKIKQFTNRKQLLEVPGIGEKAFEQAAGFLRIRSGDNPLDNTNIHPESYEAVHKIAEYYQIPVHNFKALAEKLMTIKKSECDKLCKIAGIGLPTLLLIRDNLAKPGRDPREDMPAPILRSDVLSIDDLKEGMELTGTVRNVVDFGAFVDIGIKNDALLHVSKMGRGSFVKNPYEIVQVGDIIQVSIESIDRVKQKVSLRLV
ncbi:MAG: RNA-binding transcriptional accessory protein [Bacteroidia bacterium]|nr:RNA-binding transcriptional accessory protein [Bacteroidia bacterium]MDW8346784.1 Tex family protein [Bacteroidia bacterium]